MTENGETKREGRKQETRCAVNAKTGQTGKNGKSGTTGQANARVAETSKGRSQESRAGRAGAIQPKASGSQANNSLAKARTRSAFEDRASVNL